MPTLQSVLLEAQRQIDRGRGFANAAFARGHGDDAFYLPDAACLAVGVLGAAFLGAGGQRNGGVCHAWQRLHRVLGRLARGLIGASLRLRHVQREVDLVFRDDDFRQDAGRDEIAAAGRLDGLECVEHVFFGQGISHICASAKG